MKSELIEWMNTIFTDETISDEIIALNIGFFESESGNIIYCSGSKEFDEETFDWACNEDYEPECKFLSLDENYTSLDWEEFDSKMTELLIELVASMEKLIPTQIDNIYCGYDDGELNKVWSRFS